MSSRPPTARERAYAAMREMRERFTVYEVADRAGVSVATARAVVFDLQREGLMTSGTWFYDSPGKGGKRMAYVLPESAPEVLPDTLLLPQRATLRSKMWTVIRIKRSFTVRDLCAIVETSPGNALHYVQALIAEGLVTPAGRLQPHGQPGSYIVYRLLRDVGPAAPCVHGQTTRPREEVRNV